MVFETIKKMTASGEPVFLLEKIASHKTRLFLKRIFFWLSVCLFIIASDLLVPASDNLSGLFFLSLFILLVVVALDAFYYSFRFDDADRPSRGDHFFSLAEIIASTKKSDLTGGFLRSPTGKRTLARLGFALAEMRTFLTERRTLVSVQSVSIEEGNLFTEYMKAIVASDREFEHFLMSRAVDTDSFIECALWVSETRERAEAAKRFWSKERLESIPSLGRDWAYGKAYALMHSSMPLRFSRYQSSELHQAEIMRLEAALARSTGGNALLIGDEGVGKMEVVEGLARRMARRRSPEALLDKHIFVLDKDQIAAEVQDAAAFETLFLSILSEAAEAGNAIIVIPDLPAFLEVGVSLHADTASLLIRFLSSSSLRVIAVSDTGDFERIARGSRDLLAHLEEICVPTSGNRSILRTLEDTVLRLESEENVFFTFPALVEAVRSAKRFFLDKPLLDTASDLLTEAIAEAAAGGRSDIVREDVLNLVEEKTGIPMGGIGTKEQSALLHLEDLLHKRIVGQDEAIEAVSASLRRARSGLTDPGRPLGSFLFLGPTGVGKTETAKALSEIFFGPNTPMLRLDMSEYNTSDGVNRMIGGFDSESPGTLSALLREQPYGVLLLDEFEKTDSHVLDIFLQILDEGVFTDALGRKISARNTVVIATSNAANKEIFASVKEGQDLSEKREEIIDTIIETGVFKPELLNRFDGIILFHPLENAHLEEIGKRMLERLAWRLREKGMTLVATPALISFLVQKGSDPEFGARPLNRAIQDTVESLIAKRIIACQYKNGSNITLTEEDLRNI